MCKILHIWKPKSQERERGCAKTYRSRDASRTARFVQKHTDRSLLFWSDLEHIVRIVDEREREMNFWEEEIYSKKKPEREGKEKEVVTTCGGGELFWPIWSFLYIYLNCDHPNVDRFSFFEIFPTFSSWGQTQIVVKQQLLIYFLYYYIYIYISFYFILV